MIVKDMNQKAFKRNDAFSAVSGKLAGKSCLVVGLASTGVAVSRFLKKCGARVTATDIRSAPELAGLEELINMGVDIEAGGHGRASALRPELVVVSPGVPQNYPLLASARKNGAEVISDIELAYRFIDSPVLAIAGTNGKSTVTTLLGEVLKDAGHKVFVGGNIGTPAIEYVESVFERNERADFCVLEISSFHLDTTRTFKPRVGVLLNITEDHLDRYTDFDHYARTKMRLFENQDSGDYAVVNAGDPVISKYVSRGLCGKGKMIKFTVSGPLAKGDEGLWLRGAEIVYVKKGSEEIYPADGFKLKGLHNIENAMSVIASARVAGVPREGILKTLAAFEGLSHRMEFVRELNGATYIDDSKGTNIGALAMALRGLAGPVVLIAGGRDKGGDYKVLSDLVREKVKLIVLLGEARFKIKEALGALTSTVMVNSLEEAVEAAHKNAAAGDTVLLCPACSSFDMFKSYKERGERFKAFVEALH